MQNADMLPYIRNNNGLYLSAISEDFNWLVIDDNNYFFLLTRCEMVMIQNVLSIINQKPIQI